MGISVLRGDETPSPLSRCDGGSKRACVWEREREREDEQRKYPFVYGNSRRELVVGQLLCRPSASAREAVRPTPECAMHSEFWETGLSLLSRFPRTHRQLNSSSVMVFALLWYRCDDGGGSGGALQSQFLSLDLCPAVYLSRSRSTPHDANARPAPLASGPPTPPPG